MKKVPIYLFALFLIFGSFFLGLKVGVTKGIAYSNAIDVVLDPAQQILNYDETLESFLEKERERSFASMHDSISAYGEYLNHWASKIPDITGVDAITYSVYEYRIPYYLEKRDELNESALTNSSPDFERAIKYMEQSLDHL